jgi:DNA-directed RNA polymerase specialized sigma24 family protein
VARHRLSARQAHRSRHSGSQQSTDDADNAREVVAPRVVPPARPAQVQVDQAGRHDKVLTTAEVELDRAPADVRSSIQRYWADGLDAQDIADRLAGQGVTIQNVLVERYLYPSGGARA